MRWNRVLFNHTDQNPDNLKEEIQRLPKSLSESLEALEKDTLMRDLIGEKLLTAIKGVRKVWVQIAFFLCSWLMLMN